MATEKWIAGSGVGLTWTAAITGSTMNSLANGNALLSDVQIDNTSPLDMFYALEFVAGGTATTVAPAYVGLFFYPLLSDATTYGDGRFGSAAAGPPPDNYRLGNIGFNAAASTTMRGMLVNLILPPIKGKLVIYNQGGVAFPSTGNTLKYMTYNRAIA